MEIKWSLRPLNRYSNKGFRITNVNILLKLEDFMLVFGQK